MWAPILVNFFQILFIIFGFYGAYHFRIKYIITVSISMLPLYAYVGAITLIDNPNFVIFGQYLLWNFIWIGWNAFLICFYLDVGTLNRVRVT